MDWLVDGRSIKARSPARAAAQAQAHTLFVVPLPKLLFLLPSLPPSSTSESTARTFASASRLAHCRPHKKVFVFAVSYRIVRRYFIHAIPLCSKARVRVCVCERERERECVCVCVCARAGVGVSVSSVR